MPRVKYMRKTEKELYLIRERENLGIHFGEYVTIRHINPLH